MLNEAKCDTLANKLFREMHVAGVRYRAHLCSKAEYAAAVTRFGNLILYGKVPRRSIETRQAFVPSSWYRQL